MMAARQAAAYTLRQATTADYNFLWQLHVATMREYVAMTWGWDEDKQADYFRAHFNPAGSQIIVVDGQEAGILAVERRPGEIFLSTIEILPAWQGQGLGTAVLGDLLAEAARERRAIRLQVLKVNPARRLYERLGFAVTGETATHDQLTRPAP
jgi:ribosomal protein S18 acetylase RimI-like enzyme